jgi:hypothetical protein
MKRRIGFSLLEALLGILLTALFVQGGWAVLSLARMAGERVGDMAEELETVRTVAWVLTEELSGGREGRDWWVGGPDTVALRAFRGIALSWRPNPDGGLRVCFRGSRVPNPEKDSVLVLAGDGQWRPHALKARSRVTGACPEAEEGHGELWALEPEPGFPVLGRIFERGSYHLTQGALRYRRGAGGRQPITPVRIQRALLREAEGPGSGVRWSISVSQRTPRAEPLPWSGRVR